MLGQRHWLPYPAEIPGSAGGGGSVPIVILLYGDMIPWGATILSNGTSTSAVVDVAGTALGTQVVLTPPGDWPSGMIPTALVTDIGVIQLSAINSSGQVQNIPILHTDIYTLRIWP
jgi:hypothetical protein